MTEDPTSFRAKVATRVVIILLLLMAAASVFQGSRHALVIRGSTDLGQPLKAAQVLMREEPYRQALECCRKPNVPGHARDNPWQVWPVQVPSVLMLFWPFAWLSWPAAKLVWLVSNFLFTAGLLVLVFRRFLPGRPIWLYVAIACLFLIASFYRNVIANGQHLLAALFFFLLSLTLSERGRPVLASLALSLALIKYTVIVFLFPYLVLTRQWRPLIIAGLLHAAMTVGIAAWLAVSPVQMILDSFRIASNLQAQGLIDLFALAEKLGIDPAFAAVGAILVSALLLWIAVTRRVFDQELFLAALCLLSVLLIYHRGYDFVILLIPLSVAIGKWPHAKPFALLIAASVVTVWYIYMALPRIGIDNETAYSWIMAAFCYGAAAVGLRISLKGPLPIPPAAE